MYTQIRSNRSFSKLGLLVLLSMVLAACSPSAAQPTNTTAPTAMMATATTMAPTSAGMPTPTGPATVNVANNATLGSVLVGQNGMTLYLFMKDTAGVSSCTGGCAANWPALLTNGTPVSGDPAITGKLGMITRPDGSQQVTINDMPLYYYAGDTAAGDAKGQGIGGFWFVVQPSGTPKH